MDSNSQLKFGLGVMGAIILGNLLFWGTIVFVIVHFIRKAW